MSLLDEVTLFAKDLPAEGGFASEVLDLGSERDISANRHGAGYFNVHVNEDALDDQTLILLYGGDSEAAATTRIVAQVDIAGAKAGDYFSVKLPHNMPRFVQVLVSGGGQGKYDAFIGVPLAEH